MSESDQDGKWDKSSIAGNQQESQINDHLKCGEVYTWLCEGELYAVECKLCEDRPLCPLSEFPQHMEVWHTDWEEATQSDEKEQPSLHFTDDDADDDDDGDDENHNDEDDDTLAFNKFVLFEPDEELQNGRVTNHEKHDMQNNEEILEPFEQVLIQQDIAIDATQNNEIVNEEEYFKDVNELVSKSSQIEQIERKHQREPNQHQSLEINEEITVNERERKVNISKSTELENRDQSLRFNNKKSKNNKNILKKYENFKRNRTLGSIEKYFAARRDFRRCNKITKSVKRNLAKIRKIEHDLNKIVKDMIDLNCFDETESDASICGNVIKLNILKTKYAINTNKNVNSKDTYENKRNYLNELRDIYNRDIRESGIVTSEFKEQSGESERECMNKNNINISEQNENAGGTKENSANHSNKSYKTHLQAHSNKLRKTKVNESKGFIQPRDEENETELSDNNVNKLHTSGFEREFKGGTSAGLANQLELNKNEAEPNESETITATGIKAIRNMEKFKTYLDLNKNSLEHFKVWKKSKKTIRKTVRSNKVNVDEKHESENKTELTAIEEQLQLNGADWIKKETKQNQTANGLSEKELIVENNETGVGKCGHKLYSIKTETSENKTASENVSQTQRKSLRTLQKNDKPAALRETHGEYSEESLHRSSSPAKRNIMNHDFEIQSLLNSPISESLNSNETKSVAENKNNAETILTRKNCCDMTEEQYFTNKQEEHIPDPLSFHKIIRTKRSSSGIEEQGFSCNSLVDSSTEFSLCESSEDNDDDVLNKNVVSCKECHRDKRTARRRNNVRAKEHRSSESEFRQTERILQLNPKCPVSKAIKKPDSLKNCKIMKRMDRRANSGSSPKHLQLADSSTFVSTDSLSPASPKTEEEHFEFYEPKEKLNKQHISHLIKLYKEHPRLWDQSHPDFCEPQICRTSWQQITDQWNEFCKRTFTIAEVRIRICTLCQRFVQEKERLALEGELDEYAKFPYYEQMQFLEQQKSLQKRRELYEQQNEKILEIYQHFPILWHVSYYKSRQAKEKAQAFDNISKTLKLCGLNLSSVGVQKRIRSLRKCYRLEKIRHLHAQVEQTPFQSEFRHYERMQFLDKHIEPFVCRICGRIFENLQGFRAHLDAKNHGSLLPDETEGESDLDKETKKESTAQQTLKQQRNGALEKDEVSCTVANEADSTFLDFSPTSSHIDCFSDVEDCRDILQRFSPLSSTPKHTKDLEAQLSAARTVVAHNEEFLKLPLSAAIEPGLDSLCLDDQFMEKILNNVNNNDSLSQPGLDQFMNSFVNYYTDSCATDKPFGAHIFHTKSSFIVEHPDIVADQATDVLVKQAKESEEIFDSNLLYTENGFVVEHPDVNTDQTLCLLTTQSSKKPFVADHLQTKESSVNAQPDIATGPVVVNDLIQTIETPTPVDTIPIKCPIKKLKDQRMVSKNIEDSSEAPLVVKVQCADFSLDLQLNPAVETPNDSNNKLCSAADNSTIPLPDHFIHKMIALYRKFPQLWDPNHLDYNSRKLRRQAWSSLTIEFNTIAGKQFSWRTLHRKLTDYAKYYKKLITEQQDYELMENKWTFYEDFKFMDDVIAVHDELQLSVHHRDNNFKIIAIYKTLPQLWNIKHPDYNKRNMKQRNIELMCNRLQEENNLQLTTERLKNRLIELRTQYRVAKKKRLKCCKTQQTFSSNDFEFYTALSFLDDHIDPFICDKCKMEFKKLTDYNQHLKREHTQRCRRLKTQNIGLLPYEPDAENICHICGIKFSTRSNLVHHVKRHEGIRNHACSMCPKKFFSSHALKVHIRSHTKECPYTCEKCGMSFVSASKLNQHVKRHLNKKDFQCSFCPKAFFTAFEKDRHERRHLNIRDKTCPICGKTFVAGSSYYAHLMLHSGTKRYECDKCDMKFAQYAGLYKHKKRHHE